MELLHLYWNMNATLGDKVIPSFVVHTIAWANFIMLEIGLS